MPEERIVCEFCETLNPAGLETCKACGAPLPKGKPAVKTAQSVSTPVKSSPAVENAANLQQVRQAGKKVDDVAGKALYTYSSVLGSLADAFVIALVGFGLGLVGGAVSMSVIGILGALLLGLAVGSVNKHVYLTILSAPLGLVLGMLAWLPFLLLGLGPGGFAFTTTAASILAALLGGRLHPYARRRTYDKIRPFLGAAGGLVFGLLGMFIGLGLQMLIDAFLKTL